jgi:hypothetical protein
VTVAMKNLPKRHSSCLCPHCQTNIRLQIVTRKHRQLWGQEGQGNKHAQSNNRNVAPRNRGGKGERCTLFFKKRFCRKKSPIHLHLLVTTITSNLGASFHSKITFNRGTNLPFLSDDTSLFYV